MNNANEDILMLQTIERYLDGSMLPDELTYFEQLRKNTPEIDQMVVEHGMFLHQMDFYSFRKDFKNKLQNIHQSLSDEGVIADGNLSTPKAKIIHLFNRYKKDILIAACVAGAITLATGALMLSFSPNVINNQYQQLSRELESIKRTQQVQTSIINDVKTKLPQGSKLISGGTGFLIDTKGFIVTNAHVLKGNGAIVVNNNGEEFFAEIVSKDIATDLAILRIRDKDFTVLKSLPYSIDNNNADLGEEIFTLGFPKNDITYTQGYLSSKTGLNGDTVSYQIQMNSNPGNSGAPVLNKQGQIIGVLSARQAQADGVVFAIKSKNIYALLDKLKDDTAVHNIKLPLSTTLKNKSRESQVKKLENCIFYVKAYDVRK